MKKKAILSIVVAATLLLTGAVYAADTTGSNIDARTSATPTATASQTTTANTTGTTTAATSQTKIGVTKAKSIALADAGISAGSVTRYNRTKLDKEDGVTVYEIKFFTAANRYEYEINAYTGAIVDKDVEKRTYPSASTSTSSYIGAAKAKSIALDKAGISASNVSFIKAKLDTENGQRVYDVEFVSGGMEYDYTIAATSGTVLEYDSEKADASDQYHNGYHNGDSDCDNDGDGDHDGNHYGHHGYDD